MLIENMTIMVARIDNFPFFCQENSDADVELMKFAAINITEETLYEKFPREIWEYDNAIVIISNIDGLEYNNYILPLLNNVKANIKKYLGFTVSIGFGKSYASVNDINLSYNEALKSKILSNIAYTCWSHSCIVIILSKCLPQILTCKCSKIPKQSDWCNKSAS